MNIYQEEMIKKRFAKEKERKNVTIINLVKRGAHEKMPRAFSKRNKNFLKGSLLT